MKVLISAPHLDQRQKAVLEESIQKIANSIARRAGSQAPQEPILRAQLITDGLSSGGRVVHHLSLNMQLPDHPVVVHRSGDDLLAVVDGADKAFKKEVRRACSRIRRDHLKRRRLQTRKGLDQFAAQFADLPHGNGTGTAEEPDADQAFAGLRPLLEPLTQYAADQIESAVMSGELPEGYLSPEDLVDQAVLKIAESERAVMADSEAFERKLYSWVDRLLAKETRRRHTGSESLLSLGQEAPAAEKAASALEGPEVEENEFHQPWSALRLEDILVDENADDPEKSLSDAEQRRLIMKYLGMFHSKARSAFYLNRIEGFEPYEIAMIQNRDEEKVREDIAKCVEALREGWKQLAATRERHESHSTPRPRRADVVSQGLRAY